MTATVSQTGVTKFAIKEEIMAHIFVWKFDGNQIKSLFTFLKLQNKLYAETDPIRFQVGSLSHFDHYVKLYAAPREDNKAFWIYCKLFVGEHTQNDFDNSAIEVKAVTVSAVGHLEKTENVSDLESTFSTEEINAADDRVTWWKKLCVGGIYIQTKHISFVTGDDSDLKMVVVPSGTDSAGRSPGTLDTKPLFLSEKFSDLIIQCKDKEFPAHRVVISSKSAVFASMFDCPMKESEEGRLVIEDAEPEVVEQMLKFIYTGHAQLHTLASDLFVIADKYCIQDLKDISETILVQNIDESNFLEVYPIGKLLNSTKMIDRCYEIFKRKRKDILKTEKDLKRFYDQYPELMFRFSTD